MSTQTLTAKQNELVAKWKAICQGSEQALNWIESVRDSAATVDAQADSLNIELYQALNLARSFEHVASTPMALGFFGLSQAGKSYLISSLAADGQGQLETEVDGKQRLNFIDHFNPTGEGAEATGLVTRFTYQEHAIKDPSYPLQLRLFREIDIAMILANAWFNDFDQEHVEYQVTEEVIEQTLSRYEQLNTQQPQPQRPAVSAADVVALLDYMNATSKKISSKLGAYYWPRLIKIIPYLSLEERADVFSVLWGKQPLLSNTYIQLGKTLATLGGAQTAYAPISAVVEEKDGINYKQSKDFNIMNVNTLNLLSTAQDPLIQVRPGKDGQLQNAVAVSTAELAALTAEMIFPLASTPQNEIVKKIDLLDFPGYRTRQQLRGIAYQDEQGAVDNSKLIVQLFLRGKVAYLFERYTVSQEMSALVMCTTSDMQSEVNTVGGVLTEWVNKTQGATPQERDNRCGLFWAITKMDKSIDTTLAGNDDNIAASCEGLMKKTILERFGNLAWMQEWDTGGSFNNTFLVRKPRIENTFIDMDARGNEVQVRSNKVEKLQLFREEFVRTDTVIQHIASPGEAFDAVLALNDGGIGRFSAHLNSIADISFKLTRIDEQWQQLQHKLVTKLQHWQLKEGSDALKEKQAVANRVGGYLKENISSISELLHHMKVPDHTLRNIYLSGVYNVDAQASVEEQEAIVEPEFDFFSQETVVTAPVVPSNTHTAEYFFAKAAISAWISHLKAFAERKELLATLSTSSLVLTPEIAEKLVNEIISASYRYKLQDKLTESLLVYQGAMANRREQTVEKNVLTVQLALQDFVAWFGNLDKPAEQREERLLGANRAGQVFDFYSQSTFADLPTLPELSMSEDKQVEQELFDWISAFIRATVANAGGHDENAITLEQNNALGVVLEKFEARIA